MDKNKKGLLEFMIDVQNIPELREKAEDLLAYNADLLKIAIQGGYRVNGAEVAKLRSQKEGYEFSDAVKAGKGRCWPFDYSYYIEKNR